MTSLRVKRVSCHSTIRGSHVSSRTNTLFCEAPIWSVIDEMITPGTASGALPNSDWKASAVMGMAGCSHRTPISAVSATSCAKKFFASLPSFTLVRCIT